MPKKQSAELRNNFYPEERKCLGCHVTYISNSNNQKYCNVVCARKKRKPGFLSVPRDCKICKEVFMTTRPKQQYCSTDCRMEGKRLNAIKDNKIKTAKRREEARKNPKPLQKCASYHCKKMFRPTTDRNIYCTVRCKEAHKRSRDRAIFLAQHPTRTCAWQSCNNEFVPLNAKHLYCRKICNERARVLREKNKKENYLKKRKALGLDSNSRKGCAQCGKLILNEKSKRTYCIKCWDERLAAKKGGHLLANPDGGIYNEIDSSDFIKQSWRHLSDRHHIDMTPTATNVESSEFQAEIEKFLKKGGQIKKLKVGFCQTPIVIESNSQY